MAFFLLAFKKSSSWIFFLAHSLAVFGFSTSVLILGLSTILPLITSSDFTTFTVGAGCSLLLKISDVFLATVLFTELGALPVKFFRVNFFFLFFCAHCLSPYFSLNIKDFFSSTHN